MSWIFLAGESLERVCNKTDSGGEKAAARDGMYSKALHIAQLAGRNAADNDSGFHIARDHSACRHNGSLSYAYSRRHRNIGAQPGIVTNDNGGWPQIAARCWGFPMIERRQRHLMSDEDAIAKDDAALILKKAACIDEDIFANVDIFPAIRMEWRKESECGVNGAARKLGHDVQDFFGRVVAAIEFRSEAQGLLCRGMHKKMRFRMCPYRLPTVHDVKKFRQLHHYSLVICGWFEDVDDLSAENNAFCVLTVSRPASFAS